MGVNISLWNINTGVNIVWNHIISFQHHNFSENGWGWIFHYQVKSNNYKILTHGGEYSIIISLKWMGVNFSLSTSFLCCLKSYHFFLAYSRVPNNSVDTLIKTALDFPWWLAYLIPPRLLKFSKFSISYIPTDAILRCLTRYRATRSFVRLFWRILPVLTVRESPSNQ